jgi:heterodisulfide reductase subunit A-like polyferredoxin
MQVEPMDGKPVLPAVHDSARDARDPIVTVKVECLIIGGGPAGLLGGH